MGHIKLTDFGLSKVGLMNSKLFKSTYVYCMLFERTSDSENVGIQWANHIKIMLPLSLDLSQLIECCIFLCNLLLAKVLVLTFVVWSALRGLCYQFQNYFEKLKEILVASKIKN